MKLAPTSMTTLVASGRVRLTVTIEPTTKLDEETYSAEDFAADGYGVLSKLLSFTAEFDRAHRHGISVAKGLRATLQASDGKEGP